MRRKLIVLLAVIVTLAFLSGCYSDRDHWWHRHPRHDDRPVIAVQVR